MNIHVKMIFAVFILFGITKAAEASCQAQSVSALKQKLLASGGTLNPQLVAIDRKGSLLFKSHFSAKSVSRVTSIRNKDADNDIDNDDEEIEEDDDRNDDYDDERERIHSRKRRSTTLGACFGPGVPYNNRYLLCHICDSTTVLATNYFPRYINEVICNPSKEAKCFRGQGECASNTVPTVFLKKTGQCVTSSNGILLEEWEPVTLNIRTCCECRLYPGSFLIPWTQ